jgi:hypothetical protein
MIESITHTAKNWREISDYLTAQDPFRDHLRKKAEHAIYKHACPEKPITETVEGQRASQIRGIANDLGYAELTSKE